MFLPHSFRNNLGIKLLSISLSLLLWSFVQGAKVVERALSVPIQYANLPDSLMLLETPPQELRVLVSGPAQELLLRLRFLGDVAAVLDLSVAREPEHRIFPSLAQVTPPTNARVSFVRVLSPSIIDLKLARRAERQVPVRVILQGDVPDGFCLLDSLISEPASVFCTGPEFLVEPMEEVRTIPVELPRRRGRFARETELVYDRQYLSCDPSEVQVAASLARLRSRRLDETPLTVVPPAGADLSVSMDTTTASITIAGPEPRIDALEPNEVGLFVDASLLEAGRYDSLSVIARFPDWARLVDVVPATVGVTVLRDSEATDTQLPQDAVDGRQPGVRSGARR